MTEPSPFTAQIQSLEAEPYPPLVKAGIQSIMILEQLMSDIGCCDNCRELVHEQEQSAIDRADQLHTLETGEERCEGCAVWLGDDDGTFDEDGVRLCDRCAADL